LDLLAKLKDLPCNKRQQTKVPEKAEHGLPTKKRHLLKAVLKQQQYESLAEKFEEHLKNSHQEMKDWDQVESSKLTLKYNRFNWVK